MNKNIRGLLVAALLSGTLGLAPFYPEPHIIGKLRWIAGGAHGMDLADWFDTVLHGLPWILLLYYLIALLGMRVQ